MQNYFNYFTEIEERFQQRRGTLLMLSTLDWALIETWREAGIPLEAVLRGIDAAFDRHEARQAQATRRARKVNGLAWTAQAVMEAAEAAVEASTGLQAVKAGQESGFEGPRIAAWLRENASRVDAGDAITAGRLRELASALEAGGAGSLEDLDRTLTVLEEKMAAGVMAGAPEAELVRLREQADRELAAYRGKMPAMQVKQIREQFVQKRLFEARGLPRLSLFYMPHD